MAAAKIIKHLLIERGKSVKDLADLFGITGQGMSNKLYRDNFTYDEVVKIADFLDCDVKIITRDTKKEY
ncbi:MAG: helix-turn-helix domain-containing protein [Oscillospiraceae bacterium]|jgi:DNA-binding Xre family transcriptional regulator|nr:helix-turn-helix domain-containing protein [Oscillospiraceae bacterium]